MHRLVEDVLSYRVGRPVQVKCVLLPSLARTTE